MERKVCFILDDSNGWGCGFNPASESFLVEGNSNPPQYSCLENPMDRGLCRLQSMGSQRVTHLATKQQMEVRGEWEGWTSVQRLTPPTDNQWARTFIDRGRGLHAETAPSALTVSSRLVMKV